MASEAAKVVGAGLRDRKTITIDLTDYPDLHAKVIKLAEEDERTPATWLRRFLESKFKTETVPQQ